MPAKDTGRLDRAKIAELIRRDLTNEQIAERVSATADYIRKLRHSIKAEEATK
jgi:hypothetical protein